MITNKVVYREGKPVVKKVSDKHNFFVDRHETDSNGNPKPTEKILTKAERMHRIEGQKAGQEKRDAKMDHIQAKKAATEAAKEKGTLTEMPYVYGHLPKGEVLFDVLFEKNKTPEDRIRYLAKIFKTGIIPKTHNNDQFVLNNDEMNEIVKQIINEPKNFQIRNELYWESKQLKDRNILNLLPEPLKEYILN